MKRNVFVGAFSLMLLSAFASQAQKRYVDDIFTNYTVLKDVQYGTAVKVYQGTPNLGLDFYQPANDTATKRRLIIMAHEGGFLGGDKSDNECVDFAIRMTKKGYCVANINYRVGWGFSLLNTQEQNARQIVPALWRAMQDGKAAVRFFRRPDVIANAKIDPGKIAAGGFGAGAYIFLQNEYFDRPIEFDIPKVLKKDASGNPINPHQNYIDSTTYSLTNLNGEDNFEGRSGNPGYSWRVSALLNFCGALGDTLFFINQGVTKSAPIISVHGDKDAVTPVGTALVKAAGLYDILEVSGSYDIARVANAKGINTVLNNIADILPDPRPTFADRNGGTNKIRMKVKNSGSYIFRNENYQPYDASPSTTVAASLGTDINSAADASRYMDTTVYFSASRLERVFTDNQTPSAIDNLVENEFSIYPNPAAQSFVVYVESAETKPYDLEIFDASGKLVFAKAKISNAKFVVNREGMANGLYLLKVSSDKNHSSQKLLLY